MQRLATRSRIFGISLALFASSLLAACGGGGSESNGDSTAVSQPVVSSQPDASASPVVSTPPDTSASPVVSTPPDTAASPVVATPPDASASPVVATPPVVVTQPAVLASDSFTQGTGNWKIEQQDATGTVSAANGVLDIVQPSGATLWFKQKFSGDYEIRFTATPIPITISGFTDRISDLNVFWNASVPTGTDPDPTKLTYDAALASYNPLYLYYVGFGANGNKTTRLRRNDGTAARPQITGYAVAGSASVDDKAGLMTPATSLVANTPTRVRIVSRTATQDDPLTLKWYANDVLIFSYTDAAPYKDGWFAFRTTTSHWQLSDFSVVKL